MLSAACRGKQNLFFPEKEEQYKVNLAQMICMKCPVISECKSYTERTNPEYGVWAARNITRSS